MAAAEKGTSTAQGVNEQMATAQAMRSVPKGATVWIPPAKKLVLVPLPIGFNAQCIGLNNQRRFQVHS